MSWWHDFSPFVPENVSKHGYVCVAWDPRGAWDYNNYDENVVGRSSPAPTGIDMLYDNAIYKQEDFVQVCEFAKTLPGVDVERFGIIGFSHGGSYPICAIDNYKMDYVKLMVTIEPVMSPEDLDKIILAPVSTAYDAAIVEDWPVDHIGNIRCNLVVIHAQSHHASLMQAGYKDNAFKAYNGAVNAPVRILNKCPPNSVVDTAKADEYYWFTEQIWDAGNEMMAYLDETIRPLI